MLVNTVGVWSWQSDSHFFFFQTSHVFVFRVLCGEEEQSLAELSSGAAGLVVVVVEERQEAGDTRRSLHQLVQTMDHSLVVLHSQQVRAVRDPLQGSLQEDGGLGELLEELRATYPGRRFMPR